MKSRKVILDEILESDKFCDLEEAWHTSYYEKQEKEYKRDKDETALWLAAETGHKDAADGVLTLLVERLQGLAKAIKASKEFSRIAEDFYVADDDDLETAANLLRTAVTEGWALHLFHSKKAKVRSKRDYRKSRKIYYAIETLKKEGVPVVSNTKIAGAFQQVADSIPGSSESSVRRHYDDFKNYMNEYKKGEIQNILEVTQELSHEEIVDSVTNMHRAVFEEFMLFLEDHYSSEECEILKNDGWPIYLEDELSIIDQALSRRKEWIKTIGFRDNDD